MIANSGSVGDRLGIVGGVACLIHCLLVPLVSAGLSIGELAHHHAHEAGFLHSPVWHYLDYVFLAVAGIAILLASKLAASSFIRWGLIITYSIFSVGMIFESFGLFFLVLGVAGSTSLIVFHILNIFALRKQKACTSV